MNIQSVDLWYFTPRHQRDTLSEAVVSVKLWSRSWHGWFLEQSFLVRNLFCNDIFVDVLVVGKRRDSFPEFSFRNCSITTFLLTWPQFLVRPQSQTGYLAHLGFRVQFATAFRRLFRVSSFWNCQWLYAHAPGTGVRTWNGWLWNTNRLDRDSRPGIILGHIEYDTRPSLEM